MTMALDSLGNDSGDRRAEGAQVFGSGLMCAIEPVSQLVVQLVEVTQGDPSEQGPRA